MILILFREQGSTERCVWGTGDYTPLCFGRRRSESAALWGQGATERCVQGTRDYTPLSLRDRRPQSAAFGAQEDPERCVRGTGGSGARGRSVRSARAVPLPQRPPEGAPAPTRLFLPGRQYEGFPAAPAPDDYISRLAARPKRPPGARDHRAANRVPPGAFTRPRPAPRSVRDPSALRWRRWSR